MEPTETASALIALGVLVVVFVLGSRSKLQMGIAAIVAATLVGQLLFGESIQTIQEGFPLGIFFTLLGVTYLFALATNNGTVNWFVSLGLRLVGGQARVFPLVMFVVTALLTAVGAATPAAAAILMPIALSFARRNKVNPLPMAQAIIQGATVGSFSPIGVYGVIVNSVVARSGDELARLYHPTVTWVVVMVFGLAIVLITWGMYRSSGPSEEEAELAGGLQKTRDVRRPSAATHDSPESSLTVRLNTERAVTVAGILAMVVAVVGWKVDVGLSALTIGAILTLVYPNSAKGSLTQIAWPTILLVGGIVTYVSMLERHGIIEWVGGMAAGLGTPKIAAVIILFVGAVVSAFASTTGILGALIPLSVPFLVTATGEPALVNATMLIAALCVSSSAVDVSPFSTNGALAIANSGHQSEYMYKKLFMWCWILIVTVPLLTWVTMILPPWGG